MKILDPTSVHVETSFRFGHIVVLDSLRADERATGKEIESFLRMSLIGHPFLKVARHPCDTRNAFVAQLRRLEVEAQNGLIPIVHIECHGSKEDGLQFADGLYMSWASLADYLNRINLHTGFNLLVVISACFGAYLSTILDVRKPCPCWGVIAPTATAQPTELEGGYTVFYEELVKRWSLDDAMAKLEERDLTHGAWHCDTAEDWFWKVVGGYLNTYCRIEDSDRWASEIRGQREAQNLPYVTLKDLKAFMRRANQARLREYFPLYFQTDASPAIAGKFEPFRQRFLATLENMTESQAYLL